MEKFVYKGEYVKVSEEEIEGRVYERAYVRDSMIIFPITMDGKILFIKEKRAHENPPVRWKPVTGFYEHDEDLKTNANRELQEEIGKKAGIIERYFEVKSTGTINSITTFVIARDLSVSKIPNPDGEDTILDVQPLGMHEIAERSVKGEFARGIAAYGLLKMHYEISKGVLIL